MILNRPSEFYEVVDVRRHEETIFYDGSVVGTDEVRQPHRSRTRCALGLIRSAQYDHARGTASPFPHPRPSYREAPRQAVPARDAFGIFPAFALDPPLTLLDWLPTMRDLMAHVLVVDDDDDIVESFGDLLRQEGHEVHSASSGEEGLAVLRASPLPDALVLNLDVDMPVLGGP